MAKKKLKCAVRIGDCLEVLGQFSDNSVDCIVTDPPYGMSSVDPKTPGGGRGSAGFMGKSWDKEVPKVEIWQECLRVLKPGAFAFVMCAPRQDCLARMIMRLEEAGFVTGYSSIYWVFASGFPKAQNLSKAADKRAGAKREVVGNSAAPNNKGYSGKRYKEVRPTKFGNVQDQPDATAPVTDEAKQLDGSYAGMQLKPAVEIIIVVMKPIEEKTYLDQALANGKGCSWLDDCRIPTGNDTSRESKNPHTKGGFIGGYGGAKYEYEFKSDQQGRFPANLLISDDTLGAMSTKSHGGGKATFGGAFGSGAEVTDKTAMARFAGDSGSASRYFDLDKWFEHRIGELPEEVQKTFPNLLVPKAAKSEKNAGLDEAETKKVNDGRKTPIDNPFQRGETQRANTHPTCKPVKLMSYLITMASREGEVVLDPFCGSGSTGVAAVALKRQFFGIDLSSEYVDIAKRRISYARKHGLNFKKGGKKKAEKLPGKGLWDNLSEDK